MQNHCILTTMLFKRVGYKCGLVRWYYSNLHLIGYFARVAMKWEWSVMRWENHQNGISRTYPFRNFWLEPKMRRTPCRFWDDFYSTYWDNLLILWILLWVKIGPKSQRCAGNVWRDYFDAILTQYQKVSGVKIGPKSQRYAALFSLYSVGLFKLPLFCMLSGA